MVLFVFATTTDCDHIIRQHTMGTVNFTIDKAILNFLFTNM